ncbi:hypothetical protein VNI00_005524 [Paramarasmius palmivorus]|uniref:Uncharacterized protein n=1 Tax=Paramarasmius palmivorus TaxID=297713 RepID=A0AAW0DEH0_9AGAR
MLMPLFPTMYGQLSAIAREFNFPSTTGLCLYFHFSENGVVSTPRISDDAWQMVWSPFLESSSSQRTSVCGKIEFDIDFRYARWYSSWMASAHRDQVDVPVSVVPSTAPSLAHFRSDSRVTDVDYFTPNEEHTETSSVSHAPQSTARHVPKKLSLVDRLDTLSVKSYSRPASREQVSLSPPEQNTAHVLSPIFQEDEPKTAKLDLEKRVNNWRASASLTPTALALRQGQTSLEPVNMPNTVPINETEDVEDGEINLEDFAWSVSSQGPGDYDELLSISSWSRVPSVHLANRAEGSVCLTPTTATSFGPSDYTLPSPAPSSSRVLTPDVAHRHFDDVPLTPSTVTSWGPPSEYPPSPFSDGRVSSVDLAHRLWLSRPNTPTTATSWGPGSWPTSPIESVGRPRSIHLGDRGEFSRPTTPATATSWGAPLSYPPSPTTPFYVTTPDAAQRSFDVDGPNCRVKLEEESSGQPWSHGWPYRNRDSAESSDHPWTHNWPYQAAADRGRPWEHNWPHHRSDSVPTPAEESSGPWARGWPYQSSAEAQRPWKHSWPYHTNTTVAEPWSHNWPYVSKRVDRQVTVEVSEYPYFSLYPSVYPYNLSEIYPPSQREQEDSALRGYPYNLARIYSTKYESKAYQTAGIDVKLRASYPIFDLYDAVYPANLECIYPPTSLPEQKERERTAGVGYPYFDLYPPVVKQTSVKEAVNIRVEPSYPALRLYSAVYPWNLDEIYPSVSFVYKEVINVRVAYAYPCFNLYPAVYPHLEIYPQVKTGRTTVPAARQTTTPGYPDFVLYPPLPKAPATRGTVDTITKDSHDGTVNRYPIIKIYQNVYPFLELYPALPMDTRPLESHSGYPTFDIYPAISRTSLKTSVQAADVARSVTPYPVFTLYEPVYPHLTIYPPISGQVDYRIVRITAVQYPLFDLYPAVYPHIGIYPRVAGQVDHKHVPAISVQYPVFDLYPAVYPSIEIYPSVSGQVDYKYVVLGVNVQYPLFNLYPAVYPHFDLYPPTSKFQTMADTNRATPVVRYPVFDLYPAVYPHLTLYPSISGELDCKYIVMDAGVQYPSFNLYPAVYPHIELYPPVSGQTTDTKDIRPLSCDARYPTFNLYPAVYPHFCLWPTVQPLMQPFGLADMADVSTSSAVQPPVAPRRTPPHTRKPTKSHAQLHEEFFRLRRPTIQIKIKKASKTHRQLHQEVFPGFSVVHTPSGTFRKSVSFETDGTRPLDMGSNGSARTSQPRSDTISPRSSNIPSPTTRSPTRGLPPRPNAYRLSSVGPAPSQPLPPPPTEAPSTSASPVRPVTQPLRRSVSSASSLPRLSPAKTSPTHLDPVDEVANGPLHRSTSLSDASRRAVLSRYSVVESAPDTTSRPAPRKRESLVLQRVRAINATAEEDSISSLSKKFPMPPRPPLPPLPSRQ